MCSVGLCRPVVVCQGRSCVCVCVWGEGGGLFDSRLRSSLLYVVTIIVHWSVSSQCDVLIVKNLNKSTLKHLSV